MSCLFVSLAHFEPGLSASTLRSKICDFFQTDPPLGEFEKASQAIKFESNQELEPYVASMRKTSTQGGALEIMAYCEMFPRKCIVTSTRRKDRAKNHITEFVSPRTPNPEKCVSVKWNGGHYDPDKECPLGDPQRPLGNSQPEESQPSDPQAENPDRTDENVFY